MLLPKDLLNDLEREENVKKRIKEFLDKPVDRPMEYTNPGWNPLIEVTAIGDPIRRFIPSGMMGTMTTAMQITTAASFFISSRATSP